MHFILQIRQAIQKILIQIRHQRRHRIQTAHLTEEGRSYLLSMVSAQTFEPFLLASISTHTWIGKLPFRFVRQSTTRFDVGFFVHERPRLDLVASTIASSPLSLFETFSGMIDFVLAISWKIMVLPLQLFLIMKNSSMFWLFWKFPVRLLPKAKVYIFELLNKYYPFCYILFSSQYWYQVSPVWWQSFKILYLIPFQFYILWYNITHN